MVRVLVRVFPQLVRNVRNYGARDRAPQVCKLKKKRKKGLDEGKSTSFDFRKESLKFHPSQVPLSVFHISIIYTQLGRSIRKHEARDVCAVGLYAVQRGPRPISSEPRPESANYVCIPVVPDVIEYSIGFTKADQRGGRADRHDTRQYLIRVKSFDSKLSRQIHPRISKGR